MPENDLTGRKFRIVCGSKYFETKHGLNPIIKIREKYDLFHQHNPATFLFMGRAMAEGNHALLDRGATYWYGYVNGLGEVVHAAEIGEEVKS